MLENEEKGWYGSYSLAGKRSAEKFNNIIHKNEILKGEHKRVKIPDIFSPDEIKHNNLEEKLNIYKVYSYDSDTLKKVIRNKYNKEEEDGEEEEEKKNKDKKPLKKFSLFFHNRHCTSENKQKKITTYEPGCTRYSPNYNYIWPKIITGIKWGDRLGRKYKNQEIDNRDFIINNLETYDKYVINSGFVKCFVNMDNLKKNKKFVQKNNLRIKNRNKTTVKNANIKNKDIFTKEQFKTYSNNFYYPNVSSDATQAKTRNKNLLDDKKKSLNINIDGSISFNMDNSPEIKNNLLSKTKKNFFLESKIINKDQKNKLLYLDSMQEEDTNNIRSQNKAPNFALCQSREKKIKKYKIENIPFIVPNYTYVKERSLMMAVYKKNKPTKNFKQKPFQGIISGLEYDPDKIIEKYNNHQSPKVPKFKNMISRPNKKGSPLPSYLQNVCDKSASYLTTDKSLILNNFPEGKYIPASSSFFPKKSYNKIINMKLASSSMFLEKSNDEDIQKKKKEIIEKLKLEKADYEELKANGSLDKFDNFSYKTILRKKNKNNIKKYIISFEDNEDE